MDAAGENFLYVMRSVRCADCANQQEQLATLSIDPVDLGEAPLISNASITPDTIGLDAGSEATVSATISAADTVLGVGFAALLDGAVDANVGAGRVLLDDGLNGDAAAGDGIYTAAGIVHSTDRCHETMTRVRASSALPPKSKKPMAGAMPPRSTSVR